MLSLSPHKLAIFRQCHRRYKYHYVDGLLEAYRKWWPFYTMGAHVHAALSRYLAPLNGVRDLPKLESLLQEQWPRERRGFASRDEERDYYQRGRAQLHWFFHHEDREVRPQMLEAQHSVPLDAALRLLGKVDRVDKLPDGTFQIVDYKTSRTSAYADDFQLRAYALLLTRRYRMQVSGAYYLFLNGDGWVGLEPSADDLARTEAELRAVAAEIAAERDFIPRPNRFCRWCDFLELCQPEAAEEGECEEDPFE
ncbi:MAG: RecB family exonuclease [Chloroflexota bacterium]